MTANFVQHGESITLTAPRTLTSGEGFQVGGLFAVAAADATNGAEVTGHLTGVWTLPKATGGALTQGAAVYWNDAEREATSDGATGTNLKIGHAVVTANADTTSVLVRLAPVGMGEDGAAGTDAPHVLQATITSLGETTPAYAVVPAAGHITRVDAVVGPDATGSATVAAETVVVLSIDGTPDTDGDVTITNGAAIGSVHSVTPAGGIAVTTGQVLSFASDGADTADHPATIQVTIIPS